MYKITYDEQPHDYKKNKKATSREASDTPLSISYYWDSEAEREAERHFPQK